MHRGISSSWGFAQPKVHWNYQEEPGTYPCGAGPAITNEEREVGSCTIGADSYVFKAVKDYGDNMIKYYKNGNLAGSLNVHVSGQGTLGICCVYNDEQNPTTITVYLLAHPSITTADANTWYSEQNQIMLPAVGVPYYARVLYTGSDSVLVEDRDWDDAPTTDPEDPFGDNPLGGEFADTEYFNDTVLQKLADLDEPETIDYGAFMTAYELESSNIGDIGSALFATSFWTSLKNKFEGLSDPLSMIISAVEIPFRLAVTPTTFKLGGITVEDSNGNAISCMKHTSRYIKYSFGTITMKEVWGTAKDYTDCDISIFLPYVGMRQIDTDLAINSQLTLAVIVDVWTGDLNYLLQVNNSNMVYKYFNSSGVPYRWSGNCGNKIPIGKVDPSTPILNVAQSLGSMAIGAGLMIAGGAAAGPAGAAAGATAGKAILGGAGASTFMGGAKSLANEFNSGFNPIAQSSGNISGAAGYMDYQYPYLVIKRGVPRYPNNWRKEFGAPRYQEFTISSLSGYTEFAEIHADDVSGASDDEKRMIEDILKNGIII